MCLAQEPQRSDAGEASTRGPSVWSQALYHSFGPNVSDLGNWFKYPHSCTCKSWLEE